MERKIEKELLKWKNSANRIPLILQGARQVGKTYSLLKLGRDHYKDVAYFNFESSRELASIFERDLSPLRILRELSAYASAPLVPEDTLIIFDEIQSCERALTSLKYFAENSPQYHIASAGSLLGIAINRNKYSFPVGKVEMMTMYPMDMEEFLWSQGKEEAASLIRECYSDHHPCNLHDTFMDEYRKFLGVGGMPQVVQEMLKSGDYNLMRALQKNIIDTHVADMAKYATPSETVRIMAVYNSVPAQLAKDNRKFQYKIIKSGARAFLYETAIDWLTASATVNKCLKVTQGISPLSAFTDTNSFKIYLSDTGILCSRYGLPSGAIMNESPAWETIKGVLSENYVASALKSNGFELYYWESKGQAELDFIIQDHNGDAIPVEVKSYRNVRSKSLQQFVGLYHPKLSIWISAKNFGLENNIRSVPLYAAFCIE